MKKLVFSTLVLALIGTSCADKNAYTISGTTDLADSTYVYLKEVSFAETQQTLDSALVIGGKFEMKGSATQPQYRVLMGESLVAPVVVEPGNILVDLVQNKVSGTVLNDKLQAFNDELAVARAKSDEARKAFGELINSKYADLKEQPKEIPADIKELQDKIKAASDAEVVIVKDFINGNMDNILGQYTFVYENRRFTTDEQKEFISKLRPDMQEIPVVANLSKHIAALDNTAIGAKFTDLKAKDVEGKDIALADFAGKGKVVLVDFWASWCPPCRADMPELVKMYKEYQGKDFEIVGISLDKEHADWVKGIKDLNITWPQISDLKFWESDLAATYGVRSIPHTVLIDKDGTIAARGLRGEELATKIAEMMK